MAPVLHAPTHAPQLRQSFGFMVGTGSLIGSDKDLFIFIAS
jgi:hypothetical protein